MSDTVVWTTMREIAAKTLCNRCFIGRPRYKAIWPDDAPHEVRKEYYLHDKDDVCSAHDFLIAMDKVLISVNRALAMEQQNTVCPKCGDGLVRVHIHTGTTEHRPDSSLPTPPEEPRAPRMKPIFDQDDNRIVRWEHLTAKQQTRFDEFDDKEHPFYQWWQKRGQFMLSGGGRRESIWAARGWIAREQLSEGVEVTGESLNETPTTPKQPTERIFTHQGKCTCHQQVGDSPSCPEHGTSTKLKVPPILTGDALWKRICACGHTYDSHWNVTGHACKICSCGGFIARADQPQTEREAIEHPRSRT